MRKAGFLASALLLVSFLVVSCAPKATPSPASQSLAPAAPVTAPAAVAPVAPVKAAWEIEWEKTREAAQKEGQLVVPSQHAPGVRLALGQAFKSAFGINIQWLAGGSSPLTVRIQAERRAGIYSVDVAMISHIMPYTVLKPAGILESLDKVLFLPEVTDPQEIQKVWRFGQLEWVDKDHTILVFTSVREIPLVVNTQLVKQGEIKSYRDLLKPEWKGKIVIYDPTMGSGNGTTWAQAVGTELMSWDYLRQLVEQEPLLTRDNRLGTEWVVRGKYPIGIAMNPDVIKEFTDVGAPLLRIRMDEGTYCSSSAGVIAMLKNAPHPNTAKLYVNWLLGKDAQTAYSRTRAVPSNRLDVPTEGIDVSQIPDPNTRLSKSYSEGFIQAGADALTKTKEIFGKLVK